MTEEIIQNEEIQEEMSLPGKGKGAGKISLLPFGKKNKKTVIRGPHDLNKTEKILVYATGCVCFGGVLFCLIMISLMNSFPY